MFYSEKKKKKLIITGTKFLLLYNITVQNQNKKVIKI